MIDCVIALFRLCFLITQCRGLR